MFLMETIGPIDDPTLASSPIDKTGGGFGQSDPMHPSTFNLSRPNFNHNRFRNDASDTTQAPVLLGIGGTLLFISICLLVARLWSRTRPKYRLQLDDWTVLGATVLAVVQYIILAFSVIFGLGRRARFVSFARRRTSLRLLFISQVFWYWSITLVKISCAFLLLRLKHTKRWRISLYLIIGLSLIAVVVQTSFQFLQCRPFSVYWDPRVFRTTDVSCFKRSTINANIVTFSSFQVGLDLVFSFIPITFIRNLNRPRREKIFMCVLMGLGLFASCAAIVRTMTLQGFYASSDIFRTNVNVALWAVLEQQFALIAATMPTLKAFMEMTLVRIGLFFYDEQTEGVGRGKLVDLGLLGEKDVLKKDEQSTVGRRPSKGTTIYEVASPRSARTKDEFGDTILGKEQEPSSEDLLDKSAGMKEKEFV